MQIENTLDMAKKDIFKKILLNLKTYDNGTKTLLAFFQNF